MRIEDDNVFSKFEGVVKAFVRGVDEEYIEPSVAEFLEAWGKEDPRRPTYIAVTQPGRGEVRLSPGSEGIGEPLFFTILQNISHFAVGIEAERIARKLRQEFSDVEFYLVDRS